jgi:hypothetical protein
MILPRQNPGEETGPRALRPTSLCGVQFHEASTFILKKLPCQTKKYDSVSTEMLHMFKLAEYRQDGTKHSDESLPRPGTSTQLQMKDVMFARSRAFKQKTMSHGRGSTVTTAFAPVGSFGILGVAQNEIGSAAAVASVAPVAPVAPVASDLLSLPSAPMPPALARPISFKRTPRGGARTSRPRPTAATVAGASRRTATSRLPLLAQPAPNPPAGQVLMSGDVRMVFKFSPRVNRFVT